MKKIFLFILGLSSTFTASLFAVTIMGYQLSVYRFFILILPIFIILISLQYKNSILNKSNQISKYTLFIAVWLLYAIISYYWSVDKIGWVKSIYILYSAFSISLILMFFVKDNRDIEILIKGFSFSLVLHNILGFLDLTYRLNINIADELRTWLISSNSYTTTSIYGNPNDYASLLFFGIISIMYCIQIEKNKFVKMLWILLLISSIYQMFFTYSRGNLLAVIVSVIVLFLFRIKNNKNRFILLFLLFIVFFLTMILPFNNSIKNFLSEYIYFDLSGSSESVRIQLIKNGIYFLFKSWGFGVGAGNAPYVIENFPFYIIPGGGGAMHNFWIEILTEYGFIIFIIFLILYLGLIKKMILIEKLGISKKNSISKYFCAIMIGFFICSISSSSIFKDESIWFYFALIWTYDFKVLESKVYKKDTAIHF